MIKFSAGKQLGDES